MPLQTIASALQACRRPPLLCMEHAQASEVELHSFHLLCAKLRSDLHEAFRLKKTGNSAAPARIQLSDGGFALLELKSVNRRVWELVGELRARSQAANAAIDVADITLQNLQYQKNHFLREIRHCRAFRSDERSIDLLPIEQFAAVAPARLASVSHEDDPHQFHLNRLELEELQRKELCAKRDALLARREALVEENASKRAALEGMAAQVQSLIRISQPLQQLLNLRISQRWMEQRRLALLPPALCSLLEHAIALRDTSSPWLVIEVVGDLSKAERLASPPPGLQRIDTSSVEKSAARKARLPPLVSHLKRQRTQEDAEEDDVPEFARVHPLKVTISMPLGGAEHNDMENGEAMEASGEGEEGGEETAAQGRLKLQFCCVPAQSLLAVELLEAAANGQRGGHDVAIFSHLFGEDSGTVLPPSPSYVGFEAGHDRPFNAAMKEDAAKKLQETLTSCLPAVPFKWVQPLGSSADATVLLRTLSSLRDRVLSRIALNEQLRRLERCDTSLPAGVRGVPLPPKPLVSVLSSWTPLDDDVRAPTPRLRGVGLRSFRATLRHGELELLATLSLVADFPRTPPRTSLAWGVPPPQVAAGVRGPPAALRRLAKPAALHVAQAYKGEACDNNLLHMEAELNAPPSSDMAVDVDPLYSLSSVVLRLRMLLDVYVATEGVGWGPASVCGVLAERSVRGKNRRKPFVFEPSAGQFDQRVGLA
ncbi:hypothetical protein AB1Y20_000395 [Prymnesium parvum]|uniref:THO complex subunit 5 n=1 Tax=Prymnesium parvum TaxID=97485 RepID=A0AB34K857_PRYPA